MALTVFDADMLIGYLDRSDAHHEEAIDRVGGAVRERTRRWLATATYAELLVGPLRAVGKRGADRVDRMLADLRIEHVDVDRALARLGAEVRQQTSLTIADAMVVATAVSARRRGFEDVVVESFDARVQRAFAALS